MMTAAKMTLLSIALAAAAPVAAMQVTPPESATWAVKFLAEWGWLGLFVLSALLNIYQFKRAERQAKESEEDLRSLRKRYEADLDTIRDRYEREMKDATERLITEYQKRIEALSVMHQRGN